MPAACCVLPCEEDGRFLLATARGARAFAEGEAGTLKKAYAFVEFALQVSHFLARARGAQRAQFAEMAFFGGMYCVRHLTS